MKELIWNSLKLYWAKIIVKINETIDNESFDYAFEKWIKMETL